MQYCSMYPGEMVDSSGICMCQFIYYANIGQVYHHSLCDYIFAHFVTVFVFLICALLAWLTGEYALMVFSFFMAVCGPSGLLFWGLFKYCKGDRSRVYLEGGTDHASQDQRESRNISLDKLMKLWRIMRILNVSAHCTIMNNNDYKSVPLKCSFSNHL